MEEMNPSDFNVVQTTDEVVDEQHLLDITKQELQEKSMMEATFLYAGELRGETDKQHWTGAISLEKRLQSGELTEEDVKAATERLPQSFVNVSEGAPKRCVDGRTIEGYQDTAASWYGRALGPQVQGGTAGDVIADRFKKGYETGATFVDDVKAYLSHNQSKYAPGDHVDDHAEGSKTGCGAVDGQERKLGVYISDRAKSLEAVLSAMYGAVDQTIPKEKIDALKQQAAILSKHAESYFNKKELVIDDLKGQNSHSVEKLVGSHNEVSLTLNFVEGTTFHRDHYNSFTQGKIQNFNLDVWAILEEHGEDAFYVLADAVSTVLDLTDGSLRLFVRLPKDSAETSEAV